MKNKRILWRTLGVFAVIALIGFAVASCEVEGGGSGHDCQRQGCRFVWVTYPVPSCTSSGMRTESCRYCENTGRAQTMLSLGCSFGDWEEVTPVTCEANGLRTRTCIRCEYIYQNVLHMLGHNWSDLIVLRQPTPTVLGLGKTECIRTFCLLERYYSIPYGGGPI